MAGCQNPVQEMEASFARFRLDDEEDVAFHTRTMERIIRGQWRGAF